MEGLQTMPPPTFAPELCYSFVLCFFGWRTRGSQIFQTADQGLNLMALHIRLYKESFHLGAQGMPSDWRRTSRPCPQLLLPSYAKALYLVVCGWRTLKLATYLPHPLEVTQKEVPTFTLNKILYQVHCTLHGHFKQACALFSFATFEK